MVAKKTPAKKPATKKPTAKKTTAKAAVSKVAPRKKATKKSAAMKSFRVYKNDESFATFRVTRQTFYWAVLLLFIIVSQLWILKIQMDIAALTDIILAQ